MKSDKEVIKDLRKQARRLEVEKEQLKLKIQQLEILNCDAFNRMHESEIELQKMEMVGRVE